MKIKIDFTRNIPSEISIFIEKVVEPKMMFFCGDELGNMKKSTSDANEEDYFNNMRYNLIYEFFNGRFFTVFTEKYYHKIIDYSTLRSMFNDIHNGIRELKSQYPILNDVEFIVKDYDNLNI